MGYRARVYARQCRSPRRDDAGRYITSAVVEALYRLPTQRAWYDRRPRLFAAGAAFPIAAPVSWRDIERGLRSDTFSIRHLPQLGGSVIG
jgi:hypothetical protein